jgi:hypothetical protein
MKQIGSIVLAIILCCFMVSGCSMTREAAAAQMQENSQSVATANKSKSTYLDANRLQVPFDSPKWKLGYKYQNDTSDCFEFIHDDQTVKNWTELVTAETFVGLKGKYTVKNYVEKHIKYLSMNASHAMKRAGRKLTESNFGTSYTVNEPDNVVIYWFSKDVPNEDNQMEFVRFFSKENSGNIYAVHYTIKNKILNNLGQDEKDRIMKTLSDTIAK